MELILARSSDEVVKGQALRPLYGAEGGPYEGLDLVTSGSVIPTRLALHLAQNGVRERDLGSPEGQRFLRSAQQELDLQPHDTALVDIFAQCFFLWDGLRKHQDDDHLRLQLPAALASFWWGFAPELTAWRHAASSSDGRGPLRPLAGAEAGIAFLDRLAAGLGEGSVGLGAAARGLAAQQRSQAKAGRPAAVGGFREGWWDAIELKRAPAAPSTPAPREPQQEREAPTPVEHKGPILSA